MSLVPYVVEQTSRGEQMCIRDRDVTGKDEMESKVTEFLRA